MTNPDDIIAARNALVHDYPDMAAQRAARLNLARPMIGEMASILEALAAV